jgi:hypothetical protein
MAEPGLVRLIRLNRLPKEGWPCRIFHHFPQWLQLFPRIEFEYAVKKHRSDYSSKGFTSWGQFRQTKGAVKVHLLLDHNGHLPSFAIVTNGKTRDIKVARRLRFECGTVVNTGRSCFCLQV